MISDKRSSFRECPIMGAAAAMECRGANADSTVISSFQTTFFSLRFQKKLTSELETCKHLLNLPIYSNDHCYQTYCDNSIITSRKDPKDQRKAMIEVLSASTYQRKISEPVDSNLTFINTKYTLECPEDSANSQFFSSGNDQLADAHFAFPEAFLKSRSISF